MVRSVFAIFNWLVLLEATRGIAIKGMGSPANWFSLFNQRQPLQLRRPSVGRGPQLTPGIGSMVRYNIYYLC